MRTSSPLLALAFGASLTVGAIASPHTARAHCDGLDGPVVTAARAALDHGDPNLILLWVQPKDEAEIRAAFTHTLAIRKLGPEAQDLADRYFFETVVRVHRAGEGASFTGLKPAGRDLGPALPAADRALETGSLEPLAELLTHEMHEGLHAKFAALRAARGFKSSDLTAGREYVEKYVTFIHYVEGIHQATRSAAHGHEDEADASAARE